VSHGEIHDLRGWLTTVTGRISLDVLKSARVRREARSNARVLDAFLAAASSGDVQALAAVNPAKLQSLDDV
jgi:hypothetical protein